MIHVDTLRVHHFSTAGLGEMMNHVCLQELQSGPFCVAFLYTLNAGVSNTIMILL